MAIFITDKLIAGSEINARIGAEASLRLLLTIIEIIDLGPFRPRIIGLARVGRPGQDFQLRESLAAVTHRRTDAVGSGIAAADDNHVLVFSRNVVSVAVFRIEKTLGVGVEKLHSEMNCFEFAAGNRQVTWLSRA